MKVLKKMKFNGIILFKMQEMLVAASVVSFSQLVYTYCYELLYIIVHKEHFE